MSTQTIDVQTADENVKELVQRVHEGTEIVFTSGDTPIARLVPIDAPAAGWPPLGNRIPGLHQGMIWMSDDFTQELPDEFWLGDE